MLVGHQACLGHGGGGHTSWHCRTCDARRILPATVAAMVELGANPGRGLDALMSWWSVWVRFAGYRACDVAEVVDILRAGGANVTERHRELAANAGASQVEAALRR